MVRILVYSDGKRAAVLLRADLPVQPSMLHLSAL
jgi:hypothetical protein